MNAEPRYQFVRDSPHNHAKIWHFVDIFVKIGLVERVQTAKESSEADLIFAKQTNLFAKVQLCLSFAR